MKTVAIIGGGPAGAIAAETLLRRAGLGEARTHRVIVFEEKLGWEKPCGGGLSQKVLRRYPFVAGAAAPGRLVTTMQIIAPESEVRIPLRRPLAIFSRRDLNHLLLARAARAGAQIVEDRITEFKRFGSAWSLAGRAGIYSADYLVLAAGARTRLRHMLAPDFSANDFMLTFGFFVPGSEELMRVQFYDDFEGYAWSFPRLDHLSVGICGKIGTGGMQSLRRRLGDFMDRFAYSSQGAPIFSHLLPALSVESWANLRLMGGGWAIIGDAAGLVDPLTGEGIYFAMRSGELLAESLLAGVPQDYPTMVWNEFGAKLAYGARLSNLFYRGEFLGRPVPTRLAQFAARSSTFEELLQELIEGSQPYSGLVPRLYRNLATSLAEIALSTFSRMA